MKKQNNKVQRGAVTSKVYVPLKEQYGPRGRAISMQEALEDSNIDSYLPPYMHETSRYCPADRNHSEASWSTKHGAFTIRYSIPRNGGKNRRTVVASVWVEPKKFSGHSVKGRLHIDVNKLVGPLIENILSKDFQTISEPWRNEPPLDETSKEQVTKNNSLD
jgi:hypothetical protein